MEEIVIRVETEVNPTEDEKKVKKAVANIFDSAFTKIKPSYKGSILYAEAEGLESLTKFRSLLISDHIRAAARKVFFGGVTGKAVRFCLNKQVAFVGHISFSEENAESPLGPIKVMIKCKDPQQLINWLAPRTT